ncbi:MAG TPA: pirin family protein [Candidatus Polarisedimenticolia bacterium]|jgi:hypothetical protein|nr:pirin family protein [Candidatus Polarisedimenticolia bacterium]
MIKARSRNDRGRTQFDWLDSRHTFSFGDYRDPDHMGFRALRVINDDIVQPGKGFATHSHRDMEIVTLVLEGGLEHKDSTGTSSVILPGDVQRMSAGTGITHSEWNHAKDETVHFLQIWIIPETSGITPGYEQKSIPEEERRGRLVLLASRDGRDGSVKIHQDASLYGARLHRGDSVTHAVSPGRHAFVHVARGAATLNGRPLVAGDGAAVSDEPRIALEGTGDLLVFDLG